MDKHCAIWFKSDCLPWTSQIEQCIKDQSYYLSICCHNWAHYYEAFWKTAVVENRRFFFSITQWMCYFTPDCRATVFNPQQSFTFGAPLQKIDRLNIEWGAGLEGYRSTQTVPHGRNINTAHTKWVIRINLRIWSSMASLMISNTIQDRILFTIWWKGT